MPAYTYLQFTPDSDDMNISGSSDPTRPSEGWKGRDANDAIRATNSGLRNLGDEAAKLPRNPDGTINYGPNGGNGRLGTAAFQNTESFQITGGVLGSSVRGSVGRGALLIVVCNFDEFAEVYEEQRLRGFDLCDGRTAKNPYPPFNDVTLPDFRGLYLWMVDDAIKVNTYQFTFGGTPVEREADANRTITVGNHNHGDANNNVGSFTLGYDQLPPVVTDVNVLGSGGNFQDGPPRSIQVVKQGGSQPHTHFIAPAGEFSASFNVRPPSVGVFYLLRVW